MKGTNYKINKFLKTGLFTGFLTIFLFLTPALAQTFLPDNESAKALGEAASKSSPVAYVLGFVTVACLGLTAWSIKRGDDTIDKISELTDSIKDQNHNLANIATAMDQMSRKACPLDSEMLSDLIHGKYKK